MNREPKSTGVVAKVAAFLIVATAIAVPAAAQAIRANPRLSEAQLAVGYVSWLMDWDWKAAEAAFRRAHLRNRWR